MVQVEQLSIAVTEDVAAELRAAVESGAYGSVGDVVRDALDEWRLRRASEAADLQDLRKLVRAGIESGPGIEAAQVFARLRARYGPTPSE